MKDICLLIITIVISIAIMGVTDVYMKSKKTDTEIPVIILQKDSTIKNLKVEMNEAVDKAINANDSVAIKQFIKLVTE